MCIEFMCMVSKFNFVSLLFPFHSLFSSAMLLTVYRAFTHIVLWIVPEFCFISYYTFFKEKIAYDITMLLQTTPLLYVLIFFNQ